MYVEAGVQYGQAMLEFGTFHLLHIGLGAGYKF
jgi:hypothetical protein